MIVVVVNYFSVAVDFKMTLLISQPPLQAQMKAPTIQKHHVHSTTPSTHDPQSPRGNRSPTHF